MLIMSKHFLITSTSPREILNDIVNIIEREMNIKTWGVSIVNIGKDIEYRVLYRHVGKELVPLRNITELTIFGEFWCLLCIEEEEDIVNPTQQSTVDSLIQTSTDGDVDTEKIVQYLKREFGQELRESKKNTVITQLLIAMYETEFTLSKALRKTIEIIYEIDALKTYIDISVMQIRDCCINMFTAICSKDKYVKYAAKLNNTIIIENYGIVKKLNIPSSNVDAIQVSDEEIKICKLSLSNYECLNP